LAKIVIDLLARNKRDWKKFEQVPYTAHLTYMIDMLIIILFVGLIINLKILSNSIIRLIKFLFRKDFH